MGLLDLKLKKEIELLKAKVGTLESNESSLKSWLSLAEAKVKELTDEIGQKTCAVFFHDDLIDTNQKLRNLLRQAQPSEQEAPSLFHQIKDVLKDNNSFTSKDKHELEEENRLVSEQNEVLNDTLLSMEKELSERPSNEELADIEQEHYTAWLSEKEARIHWAELWKKGCMALIGEQAKVVELKKIINGGWEHHPKRIELEASVVELREALLVRIDVLEDIGRRIVMEDQAPVIMISAMELASTILDCVEKGKKALASSTDAPSVPGEGE